MRIASAALLSVAFLVNAAYAGPPTVAITACGQAVPRNSLGLLMQDLDCTGFVGGIANTAVTLGKSAKLDLQGFTLTGGLFGVGCFEACPEGGSGACSDDGARCEIMNGTVTGAEASGITGDVVTVRNVTATSNGDMGVQGYRLARAIDSTLTQNGMDGIRAWTVKIQRTTVTGNQRFGVGGGKNELSGRQSHGVTIRESTVTDNGPSLDCATAAVPTCGDVSSGTRPKIRRSTCNTSVSRGGVPGCPGNHWCVCAIN